MADSATGGGEGAFRVFEAMRSSTYCPFAKRARIRFSPPWQTTLDFEGNVAAHAAALSKFVVEGKRDSQHGFVSQVSLGNDACDFDSVRQAFGAYLEGLAQHDDDCHKALSADKLSRDWQFSFDGMRMFLNVFAPCYPQPHSKFIDSPHSFWVFFQPEYSFDLCGIDPSKVAKKDVIRAAFRDAGMTYDGAQIDKRIEALLYMFPIRPTDEPVRWWD